MKLVSYESGRGSAYGAVLDGRVVNLSEHLPYPSLRHALADIDELRRAAETGRRGVAVEELRLLPPIPDPSMIICVGRNFKAAMQRMGLEHLKYPVLFIRTAQSQVGHGRCLVRPKVSEQFDYEGELAVVIGRAGRHIRAEDALNHVAGYTCYNDGSIRDYQRHTSQDTPGKNFWRTGACGPWLVTADRILDSAQLAIFTRVNGQLVQQSGLDDLLFDAAHVIAYLSEIFQLQPGDTIALGTPYGVGQNAEPSKWLAPGDEVSVEITGIGTLSNRVVDEADLAA